jgi:hypothetical protein
MESGGEGILLAWVGPGLPADRAGLRIGDEVLAIDGAPTPSEAAYDRISASFGRDQTRMFRVRRGKEILELGVSPGAGLPWKDLLVNAIGALAYLAWPAGFARGELRAPAFLFSLAVALELARPTLTIGSPVLATASAAFFFLLSGVQFGIELHLAW